MLYQRVALVVLALVVPLIPGCGGCGGGGHGGGTPPPPPPPPSVADIDVDADRDGVVNNTPSDDDNEAAWSTTRGAVYYYNVDDDDNNNSEDALDGIVNGANDALDLARVIVRSYNQAPTDGTAVIAVDTAAQGRVRIFRESPPGTWTSVYSTEPDFTLPIADVIAGDVTLGIEANTRIGPSWNGRVTLTFEIRDNMAAVLGSDVVLLRCAPWLMSTNLWPAQEAHVVNVGSNNLAFRTTTSSVCATAGTTYIEAPGASYSNDRWIQDSSEDGTILLPVSGSPRRRIPNVLQLARWRPIDAWCVNNLFNPDFDLTRRFDSNTSSMNYGGNLEITGPLTGWPWGRIIVGGGTSPPLGGGAPVTRRMVLAYRDYFNALALQGPYVEISTEWLAVGHVDEIVQVIPAPATPRGWAIMLSSPDQAKTILETVQAGGGGSLLVFAGRTGWQTTVDAILADAPLMALNAEVQTRIDGVRSVLQTQLGLSPMEIINVPTLFESAGGGTGVAYNPGVVNFVVLPTAGATQIIVPDPEGPDQPTDQWQAATTAAIVPLGTMAKPNVITYVDVFFSYHTLMGEAHCGVNWVRTPPAEDWWDD